MDLDVAGARYIAVEGPIGVGKTALAAFVAETLGARIVLEPTPNPFLDFDGKNGFPAGMAELPPDPAALRDIQIKSTKP